MDAILRESIKEKSSEAVARVFTAEADKHIICRDGRIRSHCNCRSGIRGDLLGLGGGGSPPDEDNDAADEDGDGGSEMHEELAVLEYN